MNPSDMSFNLAAYHHTTNRANLFNQTDFVYKAFTGPLFHTIGSESSLAGSQASMSAIPVFFQTGPIRYR